VKIEKTLSPQGSEICRVNSMFTLLSLDEASAWVLQKESCRKTTWKCLNLKSSVFQLGHSKPPATLVQRRSDSSTSISQILPYKLGKKKECDS